MAGVEFDEGFQFFPLAFWEGGDPRELTEELVQKMKSLPCNREIDVQMLHRPRTYIRVAITSNITTLPHQTLRTAFTYGTSLRKYFESTLANTSQHHEDCRWKDMDIKRAE